MAHPDFGPEDKWTLSEIEDSLFLFGKPLFYSAQGKDHCRIIVTKEIDGTFLPIGKIYHRCDEEDLVNEEIPEMLMSVDVSIPEDERFKKFVEEELLELSLMEDMVKYLVQLGIKFVKTPYFEAIEAYNQKRGFNTFAIRPPSVCGDAVREIKFRVRL